MKQKLLLFISALLGVACGLLSNQRLLAGTWLNLIFWGLVGVVLGFFVRTKKETIWSGMLYGFFLSLSFLFFGFQGAPDKVAGFIVFSLVLSVVGAAGGLAAVAVGKWLKKHFV